MNKAVFSLSADKKKNMLLAVLFAGVLLIVGTGIWGDLAKKQNKADEAPLETYLADLESRLKKTVEAVNGAGSAHVFITAETSYETVYASNATLNESGDETKSAKTTEKSLAYTTDRERGETPVVVKELCPKLCGVWIVCEGGADPAVKAEILQAVSVSLGISQNKIYVTGGTHAS